ncbi:MAG: hypothetical protein AAF927_19770 [Bacteroidota bacterium]
MEYPFTGLLKEISRGNDLENLPKLEEQFDNELTNLSVQSKDSARYLVYLSEQGLLYYFYRHHEEKFNSLLEIIKHRLSAVKANYNLEFDFEAFEVFLNIIEGSFQRLNRTISIETFEENFLNQIAWTKLPQDQIGSVSTLIGYTYAQEPQAEQRAKARLWYMKSSQEQTVPHNIANIYFLVDFFLQNGNGDKIEQANRLIDQVDQAAEGEDNARIKSILEASVLELSARVLLSDEAEEDDEAFAEGVNIEVAEITQSLGKLNSLSYLQQLEMGALMGHLNAKLYGLAEDDVDRNAAAKKANQGIEQVLLLAQNGLDEKGIYQYRLQKAALAVQTETAHTEKDIKEIVAFFKRNNDFDGYLESIRIYLQLLQRNEAGNKSYELIQEAFKFANRKYEQGQGGFSLTLGLFKLTNDLLLEEIKRPGVSWIVPILDKIFNNVIEAIATLKEEWQKIGKSLTESFRAEFLRFEPISHFNLKVYLSYQLYEIKVMQLGAIVNDDKISLKLANSLLAELENDNNPLSFIKTDWEEFKNVPNHVRNSTLNKCINISKGDLPLAAEHLDFSYRNLRSYITFKEVNRLGYFLDLKLTNNWQLEQGIRFMFYDLYKNGTIFEVVFDMPKFLVEHAQSGFFSSDLEENLSIKGTTAKKYIKIMIEVGLIRQDKNMGRKHFYRVERENVMKRLGKDQTRMIRS